MPASVERKKYANGRNFFPSGFRVTTRRLLLSFFFGIADTDANAATAGAGTADHAAKQTKMKENEKKIIIGKN